MARSTLVLACVVLASLCSVVLAQQPVVQQNLGLFDQNGGVLTVYGSGFIQRNLDQFRFSLHTPVTGGATGCTGVNGCPFFCNYRTMVINAAGTIAQCEVPYIPDGTLGITGSNYISLQVTNANGASGPRVTVATIRSIPTVITASTSNTIPVSTTGITITGSGFPSENSIVNLAAAPVYTLKLSDGVAASDFTIDLLTARSSNTLSLTGAPMAFWGTNVPSSANTKICRWGKNQIDCWYLLQTAAWILNNNVNGLFATLTVNVQWSADFAGAPNLNVRQDLIGPVQIGIIADNVAPVITPAVITNPAAFIGPNDPFITISATNVLQFPAHNSNIFVPSLSGAAQLLRCDTVSVTTSTVTCQLTSRPNAYRTAITAGTLGANPIPGLLYAGAKFTAGAVNVAFVNSAGTTTNLKFPLNPATSLPDPSLTAIPNAILLNDAPIQQDQRILTIKSTNGAFYVPDVPFLFQYSLSTPVIANAAGDGTTNAAAPLWIDPEIVLTGLFTAGPTSCRSRYPNQVEPNTVGLPAVAIAPVFTPPQSLAANDVCVILSMSSTEARILLPGAISSPVGTVVTATVLPAAGAGATRTTALPTLAATAVGIVAPGAGVGGDPHFFGFLGEKYEFAGEAGRIYNLLSDEGVQLNAEIGYWHWNRGKETIIRKLALKTDDHRVLIDAGGNHLGTEGFSISIDGASVAPSRTRKTYLGSDGWVRWHPLTSDDKFRLPLWERHQGVALVEIFLNDYKFEVLAVEEGKDAEGVWHKQPSRFLDFMAAMINERRPHGLFGQSAHLRANQRSVEDFAIEGADNDYEVTGLFGDDFTFNKFSAKK